jgi:hypothetical protein
MGISQPQNLRIPLIEKLRPFGIRVSLPPGDPFRKLIGLEWQRLQRYSSPAERAAAHWRVDIHSKITGVVAPTELVELIDVCGGRISSHIEYFVPV